MQLLFHTPGQKVTMFLETFGSDGYRANCPGLPIVNQIILPNLEEDGYTLPTFTLVDVGIYRVQYTLPKGSVSIGSYLVDVSFTAPGTSTPRQQLFQIICTAPFGNYGLTTS